MVSANHWFTSIETYTFQLYLTLVDLSLSFCFCWLLHHASLFLERCLLFGKAWREWSQYPYCHYLRDLNWRLWCVEVRTFHWTCWSRWSRTREWTLRRHWFVGSGRHWRVFLMLNARCFFGLFGDGRDSQELSLIFVEGTSCFRCLTNTLPRTIIYQNPTLVSSFWKCRDTLVSGYCVKNSSTPFIFASQLTLTTTHASTWLESKLRNMTQTLSRFKLMLFLYEET